MGFPQRSPEEASSAVFVGPDARLLPASYTCPRCRSRVAELPCECHTCGLTLISSPHLARSYHHLFPVPPFDEDSEVGGGGVCEVWGFRCGGYGQGCLFVVQAWWASRRWHRGPGDVPRNRIHLAPCLCGLVPRSRFESCQLCMITVYAVWVMHLLVARS